MAGWRFGAAAGVPVVAVSAALACRGLLTPRRRRGWLGIMVVAVAVAVAVGATLAEGGPGWWWLGLPAAWGSFAHCVGDAMTLSRCPLWWPLRVRGCRWQPVGSPRWMRFRTGSGVEQVVWVVLLLGSVAAGTYLVSAA
ncbi:metal-dependent hydrolase [Micromonospora arborensis]|uniref:metal-dependent hydrolase n=1 Tax=Micromonospora arborensis TaxID=2116518 RepID=UPI00341154DE